MAEYLMISAVFAWIGRLHSPHVAVSLNGYYLGIHFWMEA